MSTFDPTLFLNAETTEAAVKRPPLPVGDYTAIIKELTPTTWASKDGSKSGMKFVVKLAVEVPLAVREELKIDTDTLTVTDSIMLDVTEGGGLDWGIGKNGGLRRYREALGMNVAGQPYSPQRMVGQPLKVKIAHDIYNGELVEQVKGVAALG